MKRNIWIPKMTKAKLERLLAKPVKKLTDDNKDDLLDFKYFLLNFKQDAFEKGLMTAVQVSQDKADIVLQGANCVFVPKNKYWLTNIDHATHDFQSQYWV